MAPGTPVRAWQYHGTTKDLPWYHRTVRHTPKIARRLIKKPVSPTHSINTSNGKPPPILGNPTTP